MSSPQKKDPGIMVGKKTSHSYLTISILLICIMPFMCTIAEMQTEDSPLTWALIGKWFLFWAAGIRLFTTGIGQASNPAFTVTKIFNLYSKEGVRIIREFGFANIALGVMGILSVINEHWRMLAAITSTIFFGQNALLHFSRKPDNVNELIALVNDTVVSIVLFVFIVFTIPHLH